MSLARAFTKRGKRPEALASSNATALPPVPSIPTRSLTTKHSLANIDRSKISSPVQLLSTTNMLSYNAPDLPKRKMSSSTHSTVSHSSAEDSDRSSGSNLSDNMTDASSVGSSPSSPKPNHLSGYFSPPTTSLPPTPSVPRSPRRSASSANLSQKTSTTSEDVPAIPQRALSHSKQAHEQLARKRSLQHMSPRHSRAHSRTQSKEQVSALREQRSSVDMFKGTADSHPFGKELEQLNEVVEEFGGVIRDAAMEEDFRLMQEKGLVRFRAADYLCEIEPLFTRMFDNRPLAVNAAWI